MSRVDFLRYLRSTLTHPVPLYNRGGEIDIVEYVSRQTDNAFSVHTAPGCYAGETGYSAKTMLAGQHALNCDAHATNAQGCGFRSSQNVSAGIGANWDKGGVYALSWADDGIKAWFFPRKSVPADLAKRQPVPTSWRKPDMFISPNTCNPNTYFKDLGIVINTNLGGTWAEGVWSEFVASQEGTILKLTRTLDQATTTLTPVRLMAHAHLKLGSALPLNMYSSAVETLSTVSLGHLRRCSSADAVLPTAYWKFRSLAIYK